MPQRPCLTCGTLTRTGSRCPTHQAQWEAGRRPTARARGYDDAWQQVRRAVLDRDHWTCKIRRPGCTSRATSVDHIVPLSHGGARLDPTNLQAACKSCNSGKRDR